MSAPVIRVSLVCSNDQGSEERSRHGYLISPTSFSVSPVYCACCTLKCDIKADLSLASQALPTSGVFGDIASVSSFLATFVTTRSCASNIESRSSSKSRWLVLKEHPFMAGQSTSIEKRWMIASARLIPAFSCSSLRCASWISCSRISLCILSKFLFCPKACMVMLRSMIAPFCANRCDKMRYWGRVAQVPAGGPVIAPEYRS